MPLVDTSVKISTEEAFQTAQRKTRWDLDMQRWGLEIRVRKDIKGKGNRFKI